MSRKPKSTSRSTSADTLRLFRVESDCRVLGPGRRAVLWVMGCSLGCAGCLVPQSWPDRGGLLRQVDELVEWLVGLEAIEGVTLSGGEPMQQAAALARLVWKTRLRRDLGVVCYTGYRQEELTGPDQQQLLEQVDLLIDGPYQREQHADLLWRASQNQRLLHLTARYAPVTDDTTAGLEFRFDGDGRFTFAGVPPWPDFVQAAPFR